MIVYVDVLDDDYLHSDEGDEVSDNESDRSSEFDEEADDGLDITDSLISKSKSAYDLTETSRDGTHDDVIGVSIKSSIERSNKSKTFGGSDSGKILFVYCLFIVFSYEIATYSLKRMDGLLFFELEETYFFVGVSYI